MIERVREKYGLCKRECNEGLLGLTWGTMLIGCAPAQPPEIIHPFIGCWESEDGRSTEYWQHDRSGWMVGYSRNFDKDGNVSFFEHMRIEAGDNGERLVVSGMAGAPVAFERVETDNPNQFRFENAPTMIFRR